MKKFNAILVLIMALLTSQWAMAQCTGTISSTNIGATYTFTSTNPTSSQQYHSWDFGDGNFDTGQVVTHTYATSGTYTISAYFGDSINMCSDFDTLSRNVSVPGGTTCSAAFTSTSVHIGTAAIYTFTPSHYPTTWPGNVTWEWDYGDGSPIEGASPAVHIYMANGTYNVTCTLYDSNFCADTVTNTIVVSGVTTPTCNASFTYNDSNGVVYFTPTHPFSAANYYWDFGDGTTSGSYLPFHTYASPGVYNVTFSISYPNLCSDTIVTPVYIGVPIPTCDASFTYVDSNGIYNFSASHPTPTSTYSWTLSNGSTYTGANPTVTLTQPGTYTMCMDIYDASTMCSDSSCVTFTYTTGGGVTCDAEFTYTYQGNTYSFVPNTPDPSATYSWTFGDGNSSSVMSPTHTYASAGSFLVQCILTTSTGCTAFYDTLVYIPGPSFGSISGIVNMGNSYANYGVVFLVANDTSGNLALIDTTIIDSMGMYFFSNVAYGTYLVKAALSPASTNFASYLPTYHASTPSGNNGALLWSNADDVILNAPYLNNIDIDLVAGTNTGGPGFIAGLVSQGANKTGDPISDINIMVYDQNGDAVAYTYSDNQGTFQISNLPFGTYTIYPEVQGRVTTPITSTLTAMHPGEDEVKVTVNSTTVEVGITTSVPSLPEFADIKLSLIHI